MTDAAPHPLLGSTVQGFTLDAVRFTWPCATDFDASRPRRLTDVSEPGVPMRRRGAARQAHGCGTAPFEHVRIRVWHEPGATGSPPAPPSSDPPVQAHRAQAWLSRHSMMRRFLRRRGSSSRAAARPRFVSSRRPRRRELDGTSSTSHRTAAFEATSSLFRSSCRQPTRRSTNPSAAVRPRSFRRSGTRSSTCFRETGTLELTPSSPSSFRC